MKILGTYFLHIKKIEAFLLKEAKNKINVIFLLILIHKYAC